MKYIAILDTDEFKDFEFFEDADGKYLAVKDANAKSNEWLPLHFEAYKEPKTGRWKRMSDLPNDVDDRFECSRCGNVVHHRNVMDLRTFSRWCGRCGSDNG